MGLKNHTESGVVVDAALSSDLLVSIFLPGAPLHDGAVIVQKGRITAAACFLPLTLDPRLSKELGTRHRAAIGVTEESDAAVVVVSEETGNISTAVGGDILEKPGRPVPAPASGRNLCGHGYGILGVPIPPLSGCGRKMSRYWKFLTGLLLKNAGLKLASLGLALLLWGALNDEPRFVGEVRFRPSLQYLMPPHLELVDNPAGSVDVRLRGPSSILNKLEPSDVSAHIDLANAQPGERVYSITPDDISRPQGVTVTRITPSTLRLNLQPTASKEVEIDPRIVGRVDVGYRLRSVTPRPGRVLVEGPGGRVSGMTRVTTEDIDVTGRSTGFRGSRQSGCGRRGGAFSAGSPGGSRCRHRTLGNTGGRAKFPATMRFPMSLLQNWSCSAGDVAAPGTLLNYWNNL